ncbi:MAG: GNAT family N-acetyltransferase [Casimicrobiaceae bacterium]
MTPHLGSADRSLPSSGQVSARRGGSRHRGAAARSAYPAGNALRRALVTLRQEGLRSFWFKVLSHCGYRRLLLLERPLDQPVPDFTPTLPVEVAMLTESRIDDFLAFRPTTVRTDAIERLRSGQMCFVAWHEDRIVAGAWISTRPLWLPYLGCEIAVDPGEAHIYDKFTLPAFRGCGIANAVRTVYLRDLQRAGYRRATSALLPENVSSLRDDRKGGFRPCGTLVRIQIGPWRRIFLMRGPGGRA